MDILIYHVALPAVPVDDAGKPTIASQLFTVTVDSVPGVPTNLPPLTDENVAEFEVPQDKPFSLAVAHVDEAGNVSESIQTETFTATDTIAPTQPGPFGAITLIGERTEADPEPEPEPPVVE